MSQVKKLDDIDDDTRKKILNDLTFIDNETGKEIYAFDINDNEDLCVPYNYGMTELNCKIPLKSNFGNINFEFKGELKPEQKEARGDVVNFLNKQGTSILSCGVGFGKTITSINISSKIKLKTLVIVNRLLLLDQWKSSIEKFSNAKCHIIKPGKKIPESDIYIINAQNISKMGESFRYSIGFVIVDELHLIITENGIKNLLKLKPKFLLGLSATPYRSDCLNKAIDNFFGVGRVYKKLNKQHLVYKVNTKFVPEVELDFRGKINWNSVLNSQAYSDERNEIILKLVRHFKDRNVLILVKRIDQGKYLMKKLEEDGFKVDSLLGKQKYIETENKILIGTTSKCGTGFDAPKLDTLILAADIEAYFIQQLGRIFRRSGNNPMVFDLVDENGVLKKHYYSRRKVYLEVGGVIKDFHKVEEFNGII